MGKYDCEATLRIGGKRFAYFRLRALQERNAVDIDRLPFTMRIVLENLLRHYDGKIVKDEHIRAITDWQPQASGESREVPYFPARVVMQDFTGVPAVVDLAAMREAVKEGGKDPRQINPSVPVDLVIDHSVQVDFYGCPESLSKNLSMEYGRNRERYGLLKWAQQVFHNFRIFPPSAGIVHQVNLEYISRIVQIRQGDEGTFIFPDTLIGTDSHTTMIDGIGVLGWGVGGIEAEAVMLGQPLYLKVPEVVGFKLGGRLRAGVTATDLVLTITEILRREGVVEKFVEFFGPGVKALSVPDRATIGNMSPEYGATAAFFPVDERVLDYLRLTARGEMVEPVEQYCRAQQLFFGGSESPQYSKVLELDLATVEPCVAGPSRPQDRLSLAQIKPSFRQYCRGISTGDKKEVTIQLEGEEVTLGHGSVVIAAITSCTNTSNPAVMMAAGLLARNLYEKGIRVKKYVKTSLAPGSRAVISYLQDAGLLAFLEKMGFFVVAFGCTTCIGNSGPLHPQIEKAIGAHDLTVASVLSGNRNFEARIHQQVRANYLTSPPLVVAFAAAGRIDIDLDREPLGRTPEGEAVYLKDIWPTAEEIEQLVHQWVTPGIFKEAYRDILAGDTNWRNLPTVGGATYKWDENSTYIRRVPFFDDFGKDLREPADIVRARALLVLGDSLTTDHISPAGAIPETYPAGKYLIQKGVAPEDFNSYGSRRGNHEVMVRGTFANIRLKNRLTAPREGGYTRVFPERVESFVYDGAAAYRDRQVPLIVLAGQEYGTGSSRDWAAKGTLLLGVKAVIAESFERIHRSNLVGMGVLPLQFLPGYSAASLGLTGSEEYTIEGLGHLTPGKQLRVAATTGDGSRTEFPVIARLDTDIEISHFQHGGLLPFVLRSMIRRPPA
jgi:aconitate hydratase